MGKIFNFENIGGKIKGLAKALFIITAIAAVITGIVFIAEGDVEFFGALILILGPFVAWILSWTLYGYGELIEKACEIARNTSGGERKSEAQVKVDSERISKIEKLRSQGLITEEEYQQAVSKE